MISHCDVQPLHVVGVSLAAVCGKLAAVIVMLHDCKVDAFFNMIPVQVVRCLLIEPFPESALNEEAGKMLMEDYEGYAKHARYLP